MSRQFPPRSAGATMAVMSAVASTPPHGESPRRESPRRERGPAATARLLVVAWAVLCGAVVGFGWLLTHPLTGSVGRPGRRPGPVVRPPADADVEHAGRHRDLSREHRHRGGRPRPRRPRLLVPATVAATAAVREHRVRRAGRHLPGGHPPRPSRPAARQDPRPGPGARPQLPSGHVGTATAIAGCLMLLTWAYARRPGHGRRHCSSYRSGPARAHVPGGAPPHRRAHRP